MLLKNKFRKEPETKYKLTKASRKEMGNFLQKKHITEKRPKCCT